MTNENTRQVHTSVQESAIAIAENWLQSFSEALDSHNAEQVVEVFEPDGFWRDFVAFTWNLYTAEGHEHIRELVAATLEQASPRNWRITEEPVTEDGVTTAWLSFETDAGRGEAIVRIRNNVAWTLLTILEELRGFEERVGRRRPQGVSHRITKGRKTWLETRQEREQTLGVTEQPYTLIVGGGQGGIGLASRLENLQVPTLVVDRYESPGDAWRNRYKSLHLHDPVWYDHMPYMIFPDNWPVFPSKDKVADWLKYYVDLMELNYWSSTTCTNAQWHKETQRWEVRVDRNGEEVTLYPTHLVFALGVSGYPHTPVFPGQAEFAGEQHHSSQHRGGEAYAGKRAVVIGSNNSAHDICASLWEHGANVTMVQRSSTHISPSHSLMKLALGPLYSEDAVEAGIDTDRADRLFASWPYRILPDVQRPAFEQMREENAEFYQALEDADFSIDFGEDGSGLFLKYLRRGSGYYIDVGASQLIIDGEVSLRNGQVDHLTEHSVVLADGTELPADLVVYATGFGSMNEWLADIISPEVADTVGKCWGYGSDTKRDPGPWEGELRNMWKPTNVKNLWIHGGNLHQSRHYSKYLAIQLKARYEGLDTPVYKLQKSHHKS
ncbi:NAD(P)/FAD-dependent oxidoreductase [Auritidibacter sp. NML120636]|uniref:NAD(P)/FAD-dependent oxidoreductase n=1 Tax=Auritidibacter sp. NML120636 TaxID=2170743 RepID=UPI000D737234|nr:NAD(P)/FAD-dependent oxidoreductase [Auritidibacter sp. NML120636]PXA79406.1 FAD-dependent oxidoreductase [Auritidibacter sp. NML120636]